MTLSTWLSGVRDALVASPHEGYPTSGRDAYADLALAVEVIEVMENEIKSHMRYYKSCGDEADPEYGLFQSSEKCLAKIDELLKGSGNAKT